MANRHAQLAVVSAALLESAGERTAPGERSRFVGARSGLYDMIVTKRS